MKTKGLHNQLVEWRHDLHMNPQTSFEEEYASNKVANLLKDFEIEVHQGIAKTGVVGVLKKGSSNKSIGIRADMDALPIKEINTFSYKSTIDNRMHACGHDGHMTMLLGAAKYLAEHGNFDGTIYFIFQPDEENTFGAKTMIEEGLFTKFSIDEVYAIAELVRRQKGGTAIIMGSLSPKTRNSQVELYQSGDANFLVATDAIGMGINMDIDNVSFGNLKKFDGKKTRRLNLSEISQIAGRAGRHINDGSFGITGKCENLSADEVTKLESHELNNINIVYFF